MDNQIIFYAFSSQSWDCYFPIITELIKQKPVSEQWMGVYAPCNQYNFRNESSKSIFDRLKQNFKHPRDTKKKNTGRHKYVLVTTHIPDQNHGLNDGHYIHVPHGSAFGNNLTETTFCLATKLPTFTAQYQPPNNNTSRKKPGKQYEQESKVNSHWLTEKRYFFRLYLWLRTEKS